MKNEERIDKVMKKVLASRGKNNSPAMIKAYAHVISALSQVKERVESVNQVNNDASLDSLLEPQIPNLADINEVELNGKKHKINIYTD